MYTGTDFRIAGPDTFEMMMPKGRDFKILQLTDLHMGFGLFSRRGDAQAKAAVTTLVERTQPDLIVFTGDTVFPFFFKTGTINNRRQARKFMEFMDMFRIPYAFVMGNHDTEMGSRIGRRRLGELWTKGEYSIFAAGPENIFGTGNYFINLIPEESWADGRMTGTAAEPLQSAPSSYISRTPMALAFLDSNMYGDGWFFSGFDRIHTDQTDWCMKKLDELKSVNPSVRAMAFFHMPLKEFKDAYEQMKLGDTSIQYHFGGIGEKEDYFGISRYKGDFFERAHANDTIMAMFCGHDHLNSLSLTYKGIRMTYGMSIDYNGYKGIAKKQIQRGGTLICVTDTGKVNVSPEPLSRVVSPRIRGMKELAEKAMDELTRQADISRARVKELEAEYRARREAREAREKAARKTAEERRKAAKKEAEERRKAAKQLLEQREKEIKEALRRK